MRLQLDPLSPSGVSVAPQAQAVKQSHGYVTNNIRGLITAGNNVTLTGSGTESNPYQIAAGDMDTAATWGNITGTLSSQTDLTTELGNYVLKAGDTMSGALTFSGGSAPTLGKISISQVSNVSTAGIVITNSTVGAALRAWVDGANYVRIDNSSMADKGILFNGQGTGGIGIQTTATTHSVTLGSTSTGIALYNTSNQTTNYERVRQYWNSNVYTIRTEFGGTGAGRDLLIGSASTPLLIRYDQGPNGSFELSCGLQNSGAVHTRFAGTFAQSAGLVTNVLIAPTINQSSTAGYTALLINPTHSATGSGAKLLTDWQVGGVSQVKIQSDGVIFPKQAVTASAPAYVLGGIYFDTTLNKLRIGGASGWETVTST